MAEKAAELIEAAFPRAKPEQERGRPDLLCSGRIPVVIRSFAR